MAVLQYSTTLRNNQVGQIESTVGTSGTARLRLLTGTQPADCSIAETGTLIAEINLPSTSWLTAPSGGQVSLDGTWPTATAVAAGTLGYFRIYNTSGGTCHIQGDISLTAGTGAMKVDNTNVQINQQITISAFAISAGNQ